MGEVKAILRDSARCLGRNLKYILLLLLIVSLPASLLQACVVDAGFDMSGTLSLLEDAMQQYTEGEEFVSGGALSDASSKVMIYFALTALLSSFSLLVHIAVMLLCRNEHEGKTGDFRDVFEEAIRLFPKVWLTQLLASVLIAIGLMFCFLPGIFMYYVFYMVPYAVAFTGLWGRKGLFVSSLYSRKHGRKVLGMILAGIVFSSLSGMGISLLLDVLPTEGTMGYGVQTVSYCLQDALSCILVVFFSGFALSMPLDVNLSGLYKKTKQTQDEAR